METTIAATMPRAIMVTRGLVEANMASTRILYACISQQRSDFIVELGSGGGTREADGNDASLHVIEKPTETTPPIMHRALTRTSFAEELPNQTQG